MEEAGEPLLPLVSTGHASKQKQQRGPAQQREEHQHREQREEVFVDHETKVSCACRQS